MSLDFGSATPLKKRTLFSHLLCCWTIRGGLPSGANPIPSSQLTVIPMTLLTATLDAVQQLTKYKFIRSGGEASLVPVVGSILASVLRLCSMVVRFVPTISSEFSWFAEKGCHFLSLRFDRITQRSCKHPQGQYCCYGHAVVVHKST